MNATMNIGTSFSVKQANYQDHAHAQAEAAKTLVKALTEIKPLPQGVWIDLGSGPAPLAPLLKDALLSIAPIAVDLVTPEGVIADMDNLPFLPNTLTGVCSSSALQWSKDLPSLFTELATVLLPQGIIAVSLFTKGTLSELQTLQKKFDIPRGATFISLPHIKEHLATLPLTLLFETSQLWEEHFVTAKEALQSLSSIGASPVLGKPLTPQKLSLFLQEYATLFDGPIVHRYHIATLVLRKKL